MARIEYFQDEEGLKGLEQDWKALGKRFPTPLVQFEWFLSCAETLYPAGQLNVAVLYEQNRATAIAPLARVQRDRTTWLEILGSSQLYEPTNLLYESKEALEELFRNLKSTGYPLDLGRLPLDSPLLTGPSFSIDRKGLHLRRPGANTCRLQLLEGWDAVWEGMSKSRRTDFRRLRRRAEERGGYHFEAFVPSVADLDSKFDQLMEIEASGWKGNQKSALKHNALLAGFFRSYCLRMTRDQAIRIFLLRLGEVPVAALLAVEYAEALWILKMGYDETERSLSPGIFLTLETIRYAAGKKLREYEFLGCQEKWQLTWKVKLAGYGSMILLPFTIKGVQAFWKVLSGHIHGKPFKN